MLIISVQARAPFQFGVPTWCGFCSNGRMSLHLWDNMNRRRVQGMLYMRLFIFMQAIKIIMENRACGKQCFYGMYNTESGILLSGFGHSQLPNDHEKDALLVCIQVCPSYNIVCQRTVLRQVPVSAEITYCTKADGPAPPSTRFNKTNSRASGVVLWFAGQWDDSHAV